MTSQPHGDPVWEQRYRDMDAEELPWYAERLDADIAAWIDALKLPRGAKALDLGTGPGTAAIHLARHGFEVTALDISPTAIRGAQQRAGSLAERIHWVAGDVFSAPPIGPFDLTLDRGLFHVFPDDTRGPYVQRVAGWTKKGGHLLLKTFSEEEPPGYGPRRVTRAEVKQAFRPLFSEEAWQPSTFPGPHGHEPKAHLFVLRRA